jgi:hypothetical protein
MHGVGRAHAARYHPGKPHARETIGGAAVSAWGARGQLSRRRGRLALPLGISFFTFHAISYLIDVHRRQVVANRDPLRSSEHLCFRVI